MKWLEMQVGAALRDAARRTLREYWPSIAAAAVLLAAAGVATWALRAHEDDLIDRLLELEGRQLASATARALDARSAQLVAAARAWESVPAPADSAWGAAMEAMAAGDPVFRAFEWRGGDLELVRATPTAARTTGSDLDPAFDDTRREALAGVTLVSGGYVSASFQGPRLRRQVLFAAPMFHDGARTGVMVGVVRVRDLIDSIVLGEAKRGFAVGVREGPYRIYGPLASGEGPQAEDWSRTAKVAIGNLQWEFDYWPQSELLDHLRSKVPPLILLAGIAGACLAAAAARAHQLARRRLRAGRLAAVPASSPAPALGPAEPLERAHEG